MKQLTNLNSPSDETIEKLIYSGNEQDYKIGVSLLLDKHGLPGEYPTSIDFFYFHTQKSTEVYKITGNEQKEIIIGQTGILVRDLKQDSPGYDSIKTHWR